MAAYVQKATGAFPNGSSGATATATLTGVTAGNSIIAIVRGGSFNYASDPSCSVSDGTSYSLAKTQTGHAGGNVRPLAEIHYLHDVSAGTHTVVATMSAGSFNCYGALDVVEVSGLADAAPDVTAGSFSDSSTDPVTGTTSATSGANGIAIAAVGLLGSGTISLAASGYTNLYEDEAMNPDSVAGSSDYKILSATGAQSASWGTLGSSKPYAGAIAVFLDASPAVTVTDVATDEAITADQTNVVVTGTGFGASQDSGSVTIRQGSTSVTQTIDSWADTSIQFDVVFDSTTDLKYGAATLRVTEDGGAYGEIAITISPPSGRVYTDLLTPNTTAAYRLSALSSDLVAGDQVEGRGLGDTAFPSGHTIETDGTVTLGSGITGTAFEARAWDASDSTWGAWARIDVDPNPITVSPPVASLALTGQVPAVNVSAAQRVSVPAGSLSLTAYAPTVAVASSSQAVVPPVVGLTRTAAGAAIEAVGLVEQVFFYHDPAALNVVIAQSPSAGALVDEGSSVEIRVSVGAESAPAARAGRTIFRIERNRTIFRVG